MKQFFKASNQAAAAAALLLLAWSAPAATYKTIHGFAGAPNDAGGPWFGASLVGSGSTLYGMTQYGGKFSNGALFKISTTGTGLRLLHSFNGYSVLNTSGSKEDGASPYGTPLLVGSTLYGVTSMGGSNGFGFGTLFKIGTDGNGFQVLHHFGALNDGHLPVGALIISGSTLYGMTAAGGSNFSDGVIYKIDTSGDGYQILHHFRPGANDGVAPGGSLLLSGSTLFGMAELGGTFSHGTIFRMNTDGSGYTNIHHFTALANDGSNPKGSLIQSGSTLYGMTYYGGASNLGTIFQIDDTGANFQLLHSFNFHEAYNPFGDLARSGSTLYGITHGGVTDKFGSYLGSGGVFQMNTDGSGYQILHIFLFPITMTDGSFPFGSPLLLGSSLYGMTTLGGGPKNSGCVFAVKLGAGVDDTTEPTVTITSLRAGLRISNELFTVTGTARDNAALAGVYYRLNGGDWTSVTTSNNWANWTATVTLLPGTNVLSAYAMDTSGNSSATNKLKFIYVLSAPLDLQIVGRGKVTPNYDGKLLAIGKKYTVLARPAKGFAFQNWTGDIPTNTPRLSFIMRSNLVLVANFVDIARPVNVVTVPAVKKTVTNATFAAAGKAKDNVGVSNVWYQLNGAEWAPAATTNAFTNWTASELGLLSGRNLLRAFAMDDAGNASLTNSVKFSYKVLPAGDWAPDTLNGLLVEVQPSNGPPQNVTFDISSFAQAGQGGDTNSDDYTVGDYGYLKTSTNTAQLTLSNTAPPDRTNGGPILMEVIFTNYYSGIYTNEEGDAGVVNASVSRAFVPTGLAGKKLIAKQAGTSQTTTIVLAQNGVSFTKTPSITGASGASIGDYAFTRYSPTTGLLALAFTGADAGTLVYVQLTFSSATAGGYYVSSFDSGGALTDTETGTFTLK